ncbi:hypothetical protein NIES2109_33930 [Nostoc sp. HK-01]|nr:hypothetical protein NIES2109_33930 [Nostoc sp. HK-01]
MKQVIAVNTPTQPGVTLTLETTSIFLGILVSLSMLVGIAIKMVSKFNAITNDIRDLREDLNNHEQLLQQTKILQKDVCGLDKKFDIHLQDYVNYKDATLLAINGNKELIQHKAEKAENYFKETKGDIKDIQGFLNKQQNFRIRNEQC